jgi:hypothetical protein
VRGNQTAPRYRWSVGSISTIEFPIAEFLGALDDDDANADRKLPKVISVSDPFWRSGADQSISSGALP